VAEFLKQCDKTRPIYVGVVDDNTKAQAFYANKQLGFEIIEGAERQFNDYMKEAIMVKSPKQEEI
jgi:hypothetical protein